jgi:1-deoxy-D-xylulose-5-phosphate reductoisomerase
MSCSIKNIVALGSTGSIGKNALDIAARFPEKFKVIGLAAHANYSLLEKQIRQFRPSVAALFDKKAAAILAPKVRRLGTEILAGEEGVIEVARLSGSDLVLSAIVGSAGLLPTLAALWANKSVALANKEAMVMAGELMMREAKSRNLMILPVDSEHSALFQLLSHGKPQEIRRLILTASGGPFRTFTTPMKRSVTVQAALAHPTWKMGPKISIDSATLMNKGLEVIEARWLFDLPEDQIDVVLHPQSVIHALVEFSDRSMQAHLGLPDMRIPIAYALFYPERGNLPFQSLDLTAMRQMTFEPLKAKAFPLLTAAREALRAGGTAPAVLNVANEGAVMAFLKERISFLDIDKIVRRVLNRHITRPIHTIEDVLLADRWARLETEKYIQKGGNR